jgi:ketosteroid isomerase-like protein
MSQEEAEMIRAAINAWNRGDWDEALKDAAPDFVLDNSMNMGEWRGVHQGPDQVKRAWQMFTEAWQSVRIEIGEFINAGDGVLVTRQKAYFVGRDGIELPGPIRSGWLWKSRAGKLIYVATYNDLDEALEAAELSESGR